MTTGPEWREQDGARYLRVDYTRAPGVERTLALYAEVVREVSAAEPNQRILLVIADPFSAEVAALSRKALADYRSLYVKRRSRIGVAGMPRSASALLRSFNAVGGRGRMVGFATEPEALDWLLSH